MHLTADQESLMEAVQDDNPRKVNALLKKGVDPDFIDNDDSTPLGEAIGNGNFAMVKALVEAGADVNRRHGYDDEFPLDTADSRKRDSSYSRYDSYNPYHEKDDKSAEKIIEYLEQKGAQSAEAGRLNLKQQALMTAVEDGDLRKARALLDRGLDPDFANENDRTPLTEAIEQGSLALVKALAEAGADINRVIKSTKQAPLDIARSEGADTIADYLESEGAVTARATSGKKQTVKSARGGTLGEAIDSDYYFNGAAKAGKQGATAKTAPVQPAAQKPVFRENTLSDIFNAQKWIGRAQEMEELWNQVPKRLHRCFDFAASLAEARRETLKQNAPKNFRLAPLNRPQGPVEAPADTPPQVVVPEKVSEKTPEKAPEKPPAPPVANQNTPATPQAEAPAIAKKAASPKRPKHKP